MQGSAVINNWKEQSREISFYDLKGVVLDLLSQFKVDYSSSDSSVDFLHPGMSSSILLNNKEVGFMGSLHPKFLENLGFKQDIFVFSFEVENLKDKSLTSFKQFSKFPSTSRDLAFLISKETSAASIQKIIESSAGDFFKGIKIFDVYQGKGIPEDKKSIALSVSWQSMEQTLVDSDIDNVIEKIVNSVKEELDGELRV